MSNKNLLHLEALKVVDKSARTHWDHKTSTPIVTMLMCRMKSSQFKSKHIETLYTTLSKIEYDDDLSQQNNTDFYNGYNKFNN